MRAAHFIQRYPPALGGSEAWFARLSRHLVGRGHDVSVFTSTALDLEAFWRPGTACLPAGTTREDGVTVHRHALWRWPARRWLLGPLSRLPVPLWQCLTLPCNPIAPGMWAAAGRVRPAFDFVHAAAIPYAFPIACGLRLARRQSIPFLLTPFLHLGDPDDQDDPTRRQYTSPAMRMLLRAADRVFAQTGIERDALQELGIPPERIVLQGLGVDPAECTGGDRRRARQAWGAADDDIVVGHLANLSVEKGTVDLLLSAERLWRQGRRLLVVLAGPRMPNFQRFWRSVPKEHVRLLGVLDDQARRDFFAGIDLFALPSRSDSFGLVFLEAWANGRPCLAYRSGGVPGVIRDGLDGILVRPGDLDSLARELAVLAVDADLRRRLGEAGLARLPTEFQWRDKLDLVERTCAAAAGVR